MEQKRSLGSIIYTGIRRLFLLVGIVSILGSAGLYCYNRWDDERAGDTSIQIVQTIESTPGLLDTMEGHEYTPDYILNPSMDMPTINIDGSKYIGIISVPSIGIELPVMKELTYPNLKKSPCLWRGSIYEDTAIIAAHNYPSHFGRFPAVQLGDQVQFQDVDKNIFTYTVAYIDTIATANLDRMLEGAEGYDLTLFTCTYGGANRVTLRCYRNYDTPLPEG